MCFQSNKGQGRNGSGQNLRPHSSSSMRIMYNLLPVSDGIDIDRYYIPISRLCDVSYLLAGLDVKDQNQFDLLAGMGQQPTHCCLEMCGLEKCPTIIIGIRFI